MPKKLGALHKAYEDVAKHLKIKISKKVVTELRKGNVTKAQFKKAALLASTAKSAKLSMHHLRLAEYYPEKKEKELKGKRIKVPKMVLRILEMPKFVVANQKRTVDALSTRASGKSGQARLDSAAAAIQKSLDSKKAPKTRAAKLRRDVAAAMTTLQVFALTEKQARLGKSAAKRKAKVNPTGLIMAPAMVDHNATGTGWDDD